MILSGLVSATFKGKSASDVIDLASRAGLKGIEWSEGHHVAPGDISSAHDIALMTRDAGLTIVEYGSYYRLRAGADFEDSLKNAVSMEAPQIRVWAGTKGSEETTDEEREALIKDAKRILEMAAGEGIKIAFEWHKATLTDSNASARLLLESLEGKAKTLWQPNYLMEEEERYEGLEMIFPYLSNLHTFHWDESERRPLSEGKDEWERIFKTVEDGYERYALLEFVMNDDERAFFEDAKTLKALLGEKD